MCSHHWCGRLLALPSNTGSPLAKSQGRSAALTSRRSRLGLLDQKRPTTDTRLAAVSGLAKSDVTALREATRAGAPHSLRATISLDQVTNLLTVWHTHSGFSGAYGLALELDLVSSPGSPRKSFVDLVAAACPGADLEALLDELVASESVEVVHGTTFAVFHVLIFRTKLTSSESSGWAGFLRTSLLASFTTCFARTLIQLLRAGCRLRQPYLRGRSRQVLGIRGRTRSGNAD